MTLTIPAAGVDEIRRTWAGRGGLWAGVAAVEDDDGTTWTPHAARARAARIAIELLQPQLRTWPSSTRHWLDALPAQSVRSRVVSDVPGPGIDWPMTRRTGWPPRLFHHRRRSRVADSALVTTTRWTIEQLARAVDLADTVTVDALHTDARDRLDAALSVLALEPLASSHPVTPTRNDLAAMRSSGRPWTAVAGVAQSLQLLHHDPGRLATLLLDPDPPLLDRLFHVAVLGTVLSTLRSDRWHLAVIGLPGGAGTGPKFVATDPDGVAWDLWYEAAGAWSYYGVPPPYPSAVSGINGTGGPLGADIALTRRGDRMIVIECKYSANPTYVGRYGYEQTLAYMTEALTGISPAVCGLVVGPDEVVERTGMSNTAAGIVAVTNPTSLPQVVHWLLKNDGTEGFVA